MERLIQPLSDILKNHPDDSAKIIVILSMVFTAIAGASVFLMKTQLDIEKKQSELRKEDKKRLEEQDQKIRQMLESQRQSLDNLNELQKKLDKLERVNLDLETSLKLTQQREVVCQMIEATQSNIKDVEGAILTKEDRSNAVEEILAKQDRRRKPSLVRKIFSIFTKKNNADN